MRFHHDTLTIETVSGRPSYHDIRKELLDTVDTAGIENGMLVISSPHTTCSLFFEETMHDTNFFGDDYLHVDINNVMETIIPKMTSEINTTVRGQNTLILEQDYLIPITLQKNGSC
nr:hypothetical protein MIFJMLPH_00207 [Enterococcus faecium]